MRIFNRLPCHAVRSPLETRLQAAVSNYFRI